MGMPSVLKIGAGTPNSVTGGILVGPLGTTLPTTAIATPNAALKAFGYISEDGVEPQGERSVNEIADWNGDDIADLQTKHSVKFGFTTYAYFDSDVVKEVYGSDFVTVTAATESTGTLIKIEETGAPLPLRTWLFDVAQNLRKMRVCLPVAKISEVSEKPWVAGELLGFQVVVKAYKDSAGRKSYRYLDDGVFAPA